MLYFRGSCTIPVVKPTIDNSSYTLKRIVSELSSLEVGKITYANHTASYYRGYAMYNRNNILAMLDPGSFDVIAEGKTLKVNYKCGVASLPLDLFFAAMLCIFLAWFFKDAIIVVLILMAFVSIKVIFFIQTVLDMRKWLKAIMEQAVADVAAEEAEAKLDQKKKE